MFFQWSILMKHHGPNLFFSAFFWKVVAPTFGIQWGGWALSALLKTEKFYDATGSATFLFLAWREGLKNWRSNTLIQNIQAVCVTAWAARLGSFLFYRIMSDGRDRRFNAIRESPSKLFGAWTIQGVWITLTLLPSLLLLRKQNPAPMKGLSPRAGAGFALWAVGFVIEVVADYQKIRFKADPENQGKFINTGLWSWSRHPNYVGEIVMWFAMFLSASSSFKTKWEYLSILCPIFNYLLISKLSGVPMLEKYADKKWGNEPDYQHYKLATPEMFPKIF